MIRLILMFSYIVGTLFTIVLDYWDAFVTFLNMYFKEYKSFAWLRPPSLRPWSGPLLSGPTYNAGHNTVETTLGNVAVNPLSTRF